QPFEARCCANTIYSLLLTTASECVDCASTQINAPHTIVCIISNQKSALRVNRNADRFIELCFKERAIAISRCRASNCCRFAALRINTTNDVVAAFTNIQLALKVNNAPQTSELCDIACSVLKATRAIAC